MTNWEETILGAIARVKGGKRLPLGDTLQKEKNSHPYIKVTNVSGNAVRGVDEYVSDFVFEKIKRYTVDSGDIILSIVGTIGLVGKVPEYLHKASLTENCVKIIPDEKLDSDYLFYFLSSRIGQAEISKNTVGAVQPKLPIYGVQNINLLLPSIEEQKEIARVLSSLDDKIELLREENKTLEATAQSIFKEWFVNFNFPNVEGKPYKSSGGKMIDSELGQIPEGWRVGKYQDMVNVVTGKGIRKEDLINQGLYQVLGANGEIGRTDEFLFDEDLILTGRVGTLGTIYISQGKVWISDNVLISKPKAVENFYFAYFHLKRFNFEGLNRGSTQPLVTQTDLKNVDIVLPIKEMLEHWHTLCADVFIKISNNNSQIQTLSTLRDTLLPKLMSGKLLIS